ncbi:hypothetical protein [Roseateles sp.]|uniref:hypothetical protein n=1 Tax=Roseateles sp. TaxID=1971397 RepID=UPI00286D426A|nr:hypothetical protein [Roseateles sp.]
MPTTINPQPFPRMIYMRMRADHDVVGLAAVPGRLDEVHRFPGESVPSMLYRARMQAKGLDTLAVFPIHRND